ncbi:DoxX family membrane protein [Nigerium massiliense]|uniref:DoxX family membrane protein n=1 Tax=Nigerium massiliense TaxID=1522317 RepID=UPI000693240E|nr:DoxX family membrane protein [Nigerium massiliense]
MAWNPFRNGDKTTGVDGVPASDPEQGRPDVSDATGLDEDGLAADRADVAREEAVARTDEHGDDGVSRAEEEFAQSCDNEAVSGDDAQPLGGGPWQPRDRREDAASYDYQDVYGSGARERPDNRFYDAREHTTTPPERRPEDDRGVSRQVPAGPDADDPRLVRASRQDEGQSHAGARGEDRGDQRANAAVGDVVNPPHPEPDRHDTQGASGRDVRDQDVLRDRQGDWVSSGPTAWRDRDASSDPVPGADQGLDTDRLDDRRYGADRAEDRGFDGVRVDDPGRVEDRPAALSERDRAVSDEQERLAAERRARRDAREAALAPARQPEQELAPVTTTQVVRTTDTFWGSLGLFLLRAVTAFIMGVHGAQKLLNRSAATDLFSNTILPYPRYLALGVGVLEVLIAVALLVGLLTRLAGLGVTLVTGGALALVLWGAWSIFQPGQSGFIGELELLLAAVGLLLLFLGGGGWSLDRAFRRRRAQTKAERQAMLAREGLPR